MRRHNSIIKIKKRPCKSCGRESFIFSRGRCADCARIEDNSDDEDEETAETLSGLVEDADIIFSKYIRFKNADNEGYGKCYTCDIRLPVSQLQCGHYISRKCYFLRWDERNSRSQCVNCNCHKHGNLAEFGKRLEKESEGITEQLWEESRIIHKLSREELRTIINDYSNKLNQLKNKQP